jgi:predicted aspartyl protease
MRPIRAILDSGAHKIMMPKRIAEYLGLKLKPSGQPFGTAGGFKDGFIAKVEKVRIGRSVLAEFEDVEIVVLDADTPVLIGRDPFFKRYVVIINEAERSIECIRSDIYSKKKVN